MHIPPSEAKALTWWEYSAMVSVYNARHDPEAVNEADAPDPEFVAKQMRRAAERGLARSIH